MIIHALYIFRIYCQVVVSSCSIDFALNHLIKLKYIMTADPAQANILLNMSVLFT